MATKVVKPVALDETLQEVVEKLNGIKDVVDTKTFTPSVLLDNKSITENGVYEAVLDDETPCDGYAKVTVNVAGGGGALDFTSYMTNAISLISVPETWEIPADVTVVGDKGYQQDGLGALLDDTANLKTVKLADGHTGLTALGKSAFDGFKSLSTVDFVIPVNMASKGGSLPYRVFAGVPIFNPSFQNTVKYLGSECFQGTYSEDDDRTFSSSQITNENYRIQESSGVELYEYSDNQGRGEQVFTEDEHDKEYGPDILYEYCSRDGMGIVYTKERHSYSGFHRTDEPGQGYGWQSAVKPELFDWDGSPYTGDEFEMEYLEDETEGYMYVLTFNGDYDGMEEKGSIGSVGYAFRDRPDLLNADGTGYVGESFSLLHLEDDDGWWYVIAFEGSYENVSYNGKGGIGTDSDFGAFKESNYTAYDLPNLVKVQSYMFERNNDVSEFSFPNVTRIGEAAFSECENATVFDLPKCEFFYGNSFNNCYNMQLLKLTQVTSVTQIENPWDFPQLGNPVTVQVPNALLSDFQSDSEWSQLVNDNKIVLQGV